MSSIFIRTVNEESLKDTIANFKGSRILQRDRDSDTMVRWVEYNLIELLLPRGQNIGLLPRPGT